ncbi:copper chaperone PCu(A)C [Corynebacterium confusum]|uniref:copper chaperone PCu(A)C n=1 Tax=uncultured Corynebacterium sp. TaxID=159447 RepID=UPI0025DA02DE|nr:copper chaperone PCu(A)C [uncultured Corynebacterium sp.]
MKYTRLVVSAVAASALSLAACSPSDEPSDQTDTQTTTAAESEQAADDDVSFEGGVVRAMAEDSDMTAIFGTLVNHTDTDLQVESFSTSIDAEMTQLHETVDGQMSEMTEPLTIPADGEATLEPGGNHLMLMGVKEPVMAGESVAITLHLTDGKTIDLGEVPVRSIGAGDEDYGDLGSTDHANHGDPGDHAEGTDHGDHSDHVEHNEHVDHAEHGEHAGQNGH